MDIALWDFDSGDTWGFSVKEQEGFVKELAKAHPKNILALLDETECELIVPPSERF